MKEAKLGGAAAVIIAVISIAGYLVIKEAYPFGVEERLEHYYCTLMCIKTFLLGINLLADAGIICTCMLRS